MKLFGKEMTREQVMKRVGDITQVCGVRMGRVDDGRGLGMRTIELTSGTGFQMTLLPDRGLDIAHLSYQGKPVAFVSKVGLSSPALYEEPGTGFLRSFTCGMLTTCGLTQMGAACEDAGEALGIHGRATASPAEGVAAWGEWQGDDYLIRVRGEVRQARVFGENLRLIREITLKAGESRFTLKDRVENQGFDEQPLMLLYHMNFGWPFVDESSRLVSGGIRGTVASTPIARAGLDGFDRFDAPIHGYQEQVFYHDIVPDGAGMSWVGIENQALGLTAYLRYSKDTLPHLVEWKQMGEGDYVVGLEPATWLTYGRAEARSRGELMTIQPGACYHTHIEMGVLPAGQQPQA